MHWADVTSPEMPWNGGATFTQTFVYGSWGGKMIFAEPMVSRTLPTAQAGYTPGGYRIYGNEKAKEYRVALTDLPAQP